MPLYKRLYRGAYAPPEERKRLAALAKGPDLPPGERMRGRTEPPESRSVAAQQTTQQRLF
jgi:hypothetical protein